MKILLTLISITLIFNACKKKTESKNLNIIETDNIKKLVSLTLNREDEKSTINFINDLSKKENTDFSDESDLFLSEELFNYQYNNSIFFFGQYDWKTSSGAVDNFVRKALKSNFNENLKNENICDLGKLRFIHSVYRLYGKELDKMGFALCSIDTGSDFYIIMLIKEEDYRKFEKTVLNIEGFTPKHYKEDW